MYTGYRLENWLNAMVDNDGLGRMSKEIRRNPYYRLTLKIMIIVINNSQEIPVSLSYHIKFDLSRINHKIFYDLENLNTGVNIMT